MASTAYIVVGKSGEYSGFTDWFVAVYVDDRNAAEEHVRLASECARRDGYHLGCSYDEIFDASLRFMRGELKNPYDHKMEAVAAPGVSWFVHEVPILGSPHEVVPIAGEEAVTDADDRQMTWGEFKAEVERQGLTDDAVLVWIDWPSGFDEREVVVSHSDERGWLGSNSGWSIS